MRYGFALALLAAGSQAVWADAAGEVQSVTVQGSRIDETPSRSATGLALTRRETPQSLSEVSREQIDAFALDTMNDVLDIATGISVERVETDRTYYFARGMPVQSFQVDGVGLPANWDLVVGDLDTTIYERVEIIRGADGLLTGIGNPSATINHVRKRPSRDFQGSFEITGGSWDKRRVDADISGPLSSSGNWTGRIAAAGQESDSYLELYNNERLVFYGVLSGQLNERTQLTAGYSQQENDTESPLWGALPLYYTDGTPTDLAVSTSTAASWAWWSTDNKTGFVELSRSLGEQWNLTSILTYSDYSEPSQLFYVFGTPDRETGLGLNGWPGKYDSHYGKSMVDLYATGPFQLAGRSHQLALGISYARATNRDYSMEPLSGFDPLPDFRSWSGAQVPQPEFAPPEVSSDWTDRLVRAYAAAHLNWTDRLKTIVGLNATDLKSEGESYGEPRDTVDEAITPYLGAVYDLTEQVSLYASYSDIFNPQTELDINLQPLEPAEGTSYETGIKSEWFERKLFGSFALFRSKQDNLAESAGFIQDLGLEYFRGVDLDVRGFEAELSGRVSDAWTVHTGYTHIKLEGNADDSRPYLPRRTLRFATTYKLPLPQALTVGASVKWQSAIWRAQDITITQQGSYAVVDLMARYAVTPRIEAALHAENVTDRKYLSSLMWDQAFYAPPRHYFASLRYRF